MIDPEQLAHWKRLVADRPSDPLKAHWSALHAAARSLLVLVEQQEQEIARLEAELEVTTRELERIAAPRERAPDEGRVLAPPAHGDRDDVGGR